MATDITIFPPTDEPAISRSGDDYVAAWPLTVPYLTMRFSNLYEDKQGVHCELAVMVALPNWPKVADSGKLNLIAAQTRAQVANRLSEQWNGPGAPSFRALLGAASDLVKDQFRTGEPFVKIGLRDIERTYYALNPMLPENKITVVFGGGGTGKSYLALAAILAIQEAGQADSEKWLGMVPSPGNALYLDYETDEWEQESRVQRLAAGLGLRTWRSIDYRQCYHPLHQDAAAIRRYIDDNDITTVAVDSLGAAVGGDPLDAAEVIRTFAAMRSFRCTVIALDHVTKADSGGHPIGSVYKYNYARAAWETKKVQEAGSKEIRLALIHRKANNGSLVTPRGYKFTFDGDEGPVRLDKIELAADAELAKHTSVPSRIVFELKSRQLYGEAIVAALKLNDAELRENTVTQAIGRMKKSGRIVTLPDGKYGLPALRQNG